jgi:hypothetical protein
MSDGQDKFSHSRRLQQDENAIKKQSKIAKQHSSYNGKMDKEPHRMNKRHAMDCGKPGCTLCGNPRRNGWNKKDKLTVQEKRIFQDVEKDLDKNSNGLKNDEDGIL